MNSNEFDKIHGIFPDVLCRLLFVPARATLIHKAANIGYNFRPIKRLHAGHLSTSGTHWIPRFTTSIFFEHFHEVS